MRKATPTGRLIGAAFCFVRADFQQILIVAERLLGVARNHAMPAEMAHLNILRTIP
jgi:hypothetical protein